ncbi:hypothetical protein NBRC3188_2141 [Acetobacter pasteurianus NBRC 3188]|uniref:Uncharacterized protein n=1 Tax=Acetobacter pasteurianus NBRC 3188 TaxID=1226663 RepID=A0A401WVZ2_ACEPA|nr:hypothetical protein NBRC3188_2141 [Acetobacter pasteurianus NBRC 3188]
MGALASKNGMKEKYFLMLCENIIGPGRISNPVRVPYKIRWAR